MGAQKYWTRLHRLMVISWLTMIIVCLAEIPGFGAGAEYYVDIKSGLDSNDGSQAAPWRTLHYAFGAAPAGVDPANPTILHVMPGVYDANSEGDGLTPMDTPLVIANTNVHVRGECWPEISGYAGTLWATGFQVAAEGVTIEGFKLNGFVNGIASVGFSPVIKRNFISSASQYGITLSSNTSSISPRIENNLIYNCASSGINIVGNDNAGAPAIYHNTLDAGYQPAARGIYIADATTPSSPIAPMISFNIITNFSGTGAAGIHNIGGAPSFDYNNVWNNAVNYSGCGPGPHDISADPIYRNASGGDYQVLFGSLCVDAIPVIPGPANPVSEDLTGNIRPIDVIGIDNDPLADGIYDMGAFEKPEDADRDGLSYNAEVTNVSYPTDPDKSDTDSDRYHDGEELFRGTDPTAATGPPSFPTLPPDIYYVDSSRPSLGFGTQAEPWQTLHLAIHHINAGTAATEAAPYILNVAGGMYTASCCKGREPDELLSILQHYVLIIGAGMDATIIDGTLCSPYGGGWTDGFNIDSASYVTIRDLSIRNFGGMYGGSGVNMQGAQNCVVASCRIYENTFSGVNIGMKFYPAYVPSQYNVVKDGCEIFHNGEAGVYIANSHYNAVRENGVSIHDNGKSGNPGTGVWVYGDSIYGGANHNQVLNTWINESGMDLNYQDTGVRVEGAGTGNILEGNEISGHASAGNGYGVWTNNGDILIHRNTLSNNRVGIGIEGNPAGNIAPDIRNNLIYRSTGQPDVMDGIDIINTGASAVSPMIYHNTIDNGLGSGIYINNSGADVSEIKYNIITNFGTTGINNSAGAPVLAYNNVWNNVIDYSPGLPTGANDISADPDYADALSGDYHLKPASPCIDAVPFSPDHPVDSDFDGTSRPQPAGGAFDMGGYEYLFAGGSGTQLDPYQIETGLQLAGIKGSYLDKYFVLTNAAPIDLYQAPWNEGPGWMPIGTATEPFIGHFDGNCRSIKNLFIGRGAEDFVGLFGFIGPGAEVKRISLIDVNVTGRDAVGALAGKNAGGKISECLAVGMVAGNGSGTGGVGGLVGYNPGSIADCYTAVQVRATGQYVGGLVGKNFGGRVDNSYSTGPVTGMDFTAGGLAGIYDSANPGLVLNSFWNKETSGQAVSEGGNGLTTIEMRQQSSFDNWDFDGIWGVADGVSFPYLQCHGPVQFVLTYLAGPNGTISGTPSQILDHGEDSSSVMANPMPDFQFTGWSDGSLDNPRIDTAVSHINVVANFGPTVTYYVNSGSAGDDDTNDGLSEAAPWKTLHHAIGQINTVPSGTQIVILNVAAGEYRPAAAGGFEPDTPLYIYQNNLTIMSSGSTAILDGTGATFDGWKDGFDIQSAGNVVIRDLEIRNFNANGIYMGSAQNCVAETCRIHNNGRTGIMIAYGMDLSTQSSGNQIRLNNAIYENGIAGIYIFNGSGNQIINNMASIFDNGASGPDVESAGIWIWSDPDFNSLGHTASGNLISDNAIYNSETALSPQNKGVIIQGPGTDNEVIHNRISFHPESGVELHDANARIKRNTMIDNGAGIHVWAENGSTAGGAIWNNLICDDEGTPDRVMVHGIRISAETSGIVNYPTLYHNTIHGGAGDGIHIDVTGGTSFPNPSVFANIITQFSGYGILNVGSAATVDLAYNNVWQNAAGEYSAGLTPDGNSRMEDPGYVATNDYHLGSGSTCIDAIPSSAVGDDLDGILRPQPALGHWDMGCYEATSGLMHTVTFIADKGGYINGTPVQVVSDDGTCTEVRAVPKSGYEFIGWTGDFTGTANPLTITGVTSDMTVTANFRIKPAVENFTVRFTASTGGWIDGNMTQTIYYRGDCSPVTAVPEAGYEFAGWTGDYTGSTNPLTIASVTSNMLIHASFRPIPIMTYTVKFDADVGGRLDGNLSQTVAKGASCDPVTAIPETGYEFAGWNGDYTGSTNPLTVTNVTSNMTVMAHFNPITPVSYTVNFVSGPGGSINGILTQAVAEGGDCASVTAEPETGYEFAGWGGDYEGMDNPLTISHVASDMMIYANFREQTVIMYTVNFIAGAGGRIDGNAIQKVKEGGNATAVTATPDPGYVFAGWDGDYAGTDNPLILASVASDMTITAGFEENTNNQPPKKPELIAPIGNAVVPSGSLMLQCGPYADPESDLHVATWWQVRRFDFPETVYSEQSGTDLDAHEIVQGLDAGLKYSWRAAHQDSGRGDYVWSEPESFVVGEATVDENVPPVVPGTQISDYRMVSLIQWPLDPSAESVFGPLLNGEYAGERFRIGVYDPAYGNGGYREYPDFTVEPGRAYWFLARDGVDLVGEGVPVSTSVDFCVGLKFNVVSRNGWNMVAPPNNRDYRWGDLQVTAMDENGNTVFGPLPISELPADNPYIDARIFGWDAGAYTASTLPDFLLERYNGYWVRAKQDNVFLCFPASAGMAFKSGTSIDAGWHRLTAWVKDFFPEIATAFADAPDDAPPMPMVGLEAGKSGGSVGCFVNTVTGTAD